MYIFRNLTELIKASKIPLPQGFSAKSPDKSRVFGQIRTPAKKAKILAEWGEFGEKNALWGENGKKKRGQKAALEIVWISAVDQYRKRRFQMENIDIEMIRKTYPKIVSKDQVYRICHISKATALFLLQSGMIPCTDSGKKTRRYKVNRCLFRNQKKKVR